MDDTSSTNSNTQTPLDPLFLVASDHEVREVLIGPSYTSHGDDWIRLACARIIQSHVSTLPTQAQTTRALLTAFKDAEPQSLEHLANIAAAVIYRNLNIPSDPSTIISTRFAAASRLRPSASVRFDNWKGK